MVFPMSCYCQFFVVLPQCTVGWPAVCGYGISWPCSYFLCIWMHCYERYPHNSLYYRLGCMYCMPVSILKVSPVYINITEYFRLRGYAGWSEPLLFAYPPPPHPSMKTGFLGRPNNLNLLGKLHDLGRNLSTTKNARRSRKRWQISV